MSEKKILLGDVIYPDILENPFLNELYEDLLINYAISTLSLKNTEMRSLDVNSLLIFADLLSKSNNPQNRMLHQNLAQEIASLVNELYGEDPDVRYFLGSVLSAVGNYRGVSLKSGSYRSLVPEEEYGQELEKEFLSVPKAPGKYFFPEQKKVFDELNSEAFSFSAATSLGKTFVITSFITSRIADGYVSNYAIVIPTKALISEVSQSLGLKLRQSAQGRRYRILTNFLPSEPERNCSYIAVMTPERLHHSVCLNKDFRIDWLFIDEAYKISQKNNKRSTYYYDLIDELQFSGRLPHIVFASPGVPNPELYLGLYQSANADSGKNLRLSFSPVSQMKFLFDETTGEIFIYNCIKKEPVTVCRDINLRYYEIISMMQKKGKKSIVYCGARKKVEESAQEYQDYANDSGNPGLVKLSEKLKKEVHKDFLLAETIRHGIGYHMGFLPASIRNYIETGFRDPKSGLDVVFCTSTLLEGVNLPADNIFITSTKNGEEMSSLDFRNLMGRVGRIEYNLHGNVFLIHRKYTKSSIRDFRNLIEKPIEIQTFSFADVLTHDVKQRIIGNLKEGKVGTAEITDEDDSRTILERTISNKLLKDIVNGKSGILREAFNDVLSEDEAESIDKAFPQNVPIPEDIYISVDQNGNLINKIINGLNYPQPNAGLDGIKKFLQSLKDAFSWERYEPDSLGKGESVGHYAYQVMKWVNGADIKELVSTEIKSREKYMKGKNPSYSISGDKTEINKCISKVLKELDEIIGFKLCRYFQQYSETFEFCHGVKPSPDWHEFLEYGSRFPTNIWLSKQGYTREAAKLIAKQEKKYMIKSEAGWKLNLTELLNSDDELIRAETERISLMQGYME